MKIDLTEDGSEIIKELAGKIKRLPKSVVGGIVNLNNMYHLLLSVNRGGDDFDDYYQGFVLREIPRDKYGKSPLLEKFNSILKQLGDIPPDIDYFDTDTQFSEVDFV